MTGLFEGAVDFGGGSLFSAGGIDMFLATSTDQYTNYLVIIRMIAHPLTGFLLFRFGWGLIRDIPFPAWTVFIPGILIVPIAYAITYAATTFITPSPIEIPIDIWSRYFLYLPGSVMAGIGFIRQGNVQRKSGFSAQLLKIKLLKLRNYY